MATIESKEKCFDFENLIIGFWSLFSQRLNLATLRLIFLIKNQIYENF